MTEPEHVLRAKLTAVFARQDFYEACRRRDAGAMIRILNAGGITQGQIAARTGFAQSTLSNYKRGVNAAQFASTFEKLADGLGMPLPLRQALGLSGDASPARPGPAGGAVAGIPAGMIDLQLLAEAVGRNGAPVRRRDLLALAAQLGATAVVDPDIWERLSHALTRPGTVDEALVREMEARSAGFYLLEEIVPAQAVLKVLTAHLREVSTLLAGTASDPADDLRRRLIVAAGESSLLAGWSASSLGDSGAARNLYDTAVTAAGEARDPAMTACALAYRSYIPSANGANGRARILLAQALENVPAQASPATAAWVAARHAEESAIVGDKPQALKSWRTAEEAFSVADPDEDRPWAKFLNPGPVRHLPHHHLPQDRQVRRSPAGRRCAARPAVPGRGQAGRGDPGEHRRRAPGPRRSRRSREGGPGRPGDHPGDRVHLVAAEIRGHRPRPAALAAAARGPRLPGGVRHDQAPVRPVPALSTGRAPQPRLLFRHRRL
jgi:transcriptional regulator with XRE-family HTH domain